LHDDDNVALTREHAVSFPARTRTRIASAVASELHNIRGIKALQFSILFIGKIGRRGGSPAFVIGNVIPVNLARPDQQIEGPLPNATSVLVSWIAWQHSRQQFLLRFVICGERRNVAIEHLPR
jgi:hypothetical protein